MEATASRGGHARTEDFLKMAVSRKKGQGVQYLHCIDLHGMYEYLAPSSSSEDSWWVGNCKTGVMLGLIERGQNYRHISF